MNGCFYDFWLKFLLFLFSNGVNRHTTRRIRYTKYTDTTKDDFSNLSPMNFHRGIVISWFHPHEVYVANLLINQLCFLESAPLIRCFSLTFKFPKRAREISQGYDAIWLPSLFLYNIWLQFHIENKDCITNVSFDKFI